MNKGYGSHLFNKWIPILTELQMTNDTQISSNIY